MNRRINLIIAPISFLAVILLIFLNLNASSLFNFGVSSNSAVNSQFSYQMYALGLAWIILFIAFLLDRQNFKLFFHFGDIKANTEPVKILGIKAEDNWLKVGILMSIIITAATSVYIILLVIAGNTLNDQWLVLLPWIFLFAFLNSFSEEMITRLAIVSPLYENIPTKYILWISAAVFGIPHFFGTPGGILGVIMAGFLGWILSKSIAETKGIFWAWFIHFLQDVVIIFGILLFLL